MRYSLSLKQPYKFEATETEDIIVSTQPNEMIAITGADLTLLQVIAVARNMHRVELSTTTADLLGETSRALQAKVRDILPQPNAEGKVDPISQLKKRMEELKIEIEALKKNIEIAREEDVSKLEEELQQKLKEVEEAEITIRLKMIYGVTTGFGELKGVYCKNEEVAEELQHNIVLSHASGVGSNFDRETTRAIMLLRANTLASGRCGIRAEVVQQLVNMINADVLPVIPEQGSVGASGDLAPLSHLALGLIGEGPVIHSGDEHPTLSVLLEIHPELLQVRPEERIETSVKLTFKEGLALVNGITVTTGIGVMAYHDAQKLVKWADAIGAMTLESILGASRAFDDIVFTNYYHDGAKASARFILDRMITESNLINRSADVHDPYSVRCIPQVHGAARDAMEYIEKTLRNQLNSVDDDPIFFTEEEINDNKPLDVRRPPSGTSSEDWRKRTQFEQGSFHGEPIAFAMDLLAIIVSELGSISERRIQMLLDKNHNRGLPACLIDNPEGTKSGYMIAQYTAAALVSENKGLCHPASVDSIPTSANTEDHVSMGTIAARKARKVIENVSNILAIELLCASEALSFRTGDQKITLPNTTHLEKEERERKKLKVDRTGTCGTGTSAIYERVKSMKLLLEGEDKVLSPMIKEARNLLNNDLEVWLSG